MINDVFKEIHEGINKIINSMDFSSITQDSFMRFAKFYGDVVPTDEQFDYKLHTIADLINKGESDINSIATKSGCSLIECILKIKYLKNKRVIGDYYIDTYNNVLLPCTVEDAELLEKYKAYIYHSHLQIDEIANYISNPECLSTGELKMKIYNDLKYLNDKGLINGIKFDEIDKRIIYYAIEKKKKTLGYITKHCPNCGALVDVSDEQKTRCSYCNSIVSYID